MTRPSWQDFSTHDESAYPQLWDGVVGAWCPSLGPTGLRLHDHSRFVNWGTLTNMDATTDWILSGGQYALNFDATNNTVTIAGDRIYIAAGQPMTASIWFFNRVFTSFYPKLLMLKSDCAGNNAFEIGLSNQPNYLGVLIGTATSYARLKTDTAAASLTGSWQHVAVVYNGGTRSSASSFTVYLNGIARATSAASDFSLTTNATSLARNAGFNQHDGLIDDVAVFNRTFTAGEIMQLYTLGRGGMYQRRRRTLRRVAIEQPTGARRRRILTGMV